MSWTKHSKVIVGNRYGNLTVISREPNNKHGGSMYRCRCKCGTELTTFGAGLSGGTKIQCGKCGRKPHLDKIHAARRLDPGKAARHAVFLQNRNGARKRNLSWELSESQFHTIGQLPCRYCGRKNTNLAKDGYGVYGEHRYNGIDRLDPESGYTCENCAACCWVCNRAKSTMTEHEFMRWVNLVYSHSASSYVGATDFEI